MPTHGPWHEDGERTDLLDDHDHDDDDLELEDDEPDEVEVEG